MVVEEDELGGGAAMAAEVDNVGLEFQQGLVQVVGAEGPARDQLEGIAVLGGPDLGGDLADFLVEVQRLGASGIGGEEEDPNLVHRRSGSHARS